ncbi:hypothetical protein AMATHDRAFT_4487 [Amanita thiersii Skay4041]|uniref:Cytochrome P450 n=1 Tax=Amanita thiersii Skay4041 TaxID=703135 RepID=A0A2A9NFT1_9AGAR|nr:hypothetical protein AMATHDRAFT_4487 [Amanita thiersii Skay4041]
MIGDVLTISWRELRISAFGTETKLRTVTIALACFLSFTISRVAKLYNGLKAVGYLPGFRIPFQPTAAPGAILPTTRWNPGMFGPWKWRHWFYKKFNNETVSIVPFIMGEPALYTSNLDIARQVVAGGHKSSFIKPISASRALLAWGMNLFTADGENWRKHRRIMGPAFNNRLYQHVWNETLKVYHEMVACEGWTEKGWNDVPVAQKLTFKLALLVLSRCAFGLSVGWNVVPRTPDAAMTVQEAIRIYSDNSNIPLLAPWLLKLPFKRFKDIATARQVLTRFMESSVAEKKGAVRERAEKTDQGSSDVFTLLVEANEEEAGKFKLSDSELIGNVFLMIFAGHETTAHTLSATLGLLAVHQDVQEEVVEQIVTEIGLDHDPSLDDYNKLNKVLACFYEAIRLFQAAAGYVMIREATEDTTLTIPNPPGQDGSTTMPISKGLRVVVDMIGVQYNPRYFDEPMKFKPSRWYGVSNESEMFSGFSVGSRACIGRRFALTESVCFLAMLLRDWRIKPILEPNETKEAWAARILDARVFLTLGVVGVPIRFSRRK